MRLDINLATNVYEDARQFWQRWGVVLAILGVVTLGLLAMTISGYFEARQDRAKIAELESKIAERDKERADAEALLNLPPNRVIRDKSQYLNDLIARKAFSWTKAFEDLERVMPARIHLVSIQPQLNDDNQLAIKMVVAGESSERAIELVRHMEDSQHFRETRIENFGTATQQQGSTDTVQVAINALYVPTYDDAKDQLKDQTRDQPKAQPKPQPKTQPKAQRSAK
jgi:type IV pilus assembly protein PilN